jgi:type I restriction enzyme S subunit
MTSAWQKILLRDACFKTKQWKPRTEPRDDFYYIDVSAVSNDTFTITSPQAVTGTSAPGRARKIVHDRDVIYATVRPTLRRIALVPSEYHDHIASTAFCVVRADRKFAVPEFLYFLLLSDKVNNAIAEAQHGASYPAVTDKDILKQEVSLPPLPEQKKIGAVLLKIQQAIETQEKVIQSLRDLKKSTMQHVFTHGLRGEKTKMTAIGEIPESWEVESFVQFAVLHRGFDITKNQQRPGCVPVVSSGGVSSYHDTAKVQAPGVVIGRKGSLGTVHYLDIDYWPHDTTLWVEDFRGNLPLYIYYFLQTLRLERFDSGASNPTLNRNTVHKELVGVPPLLQQTEIAQGLRSIDTKEGLHQSKKSALQDLFKTTLNKLMTGGIRVMDLDIDVKEVEG